LVGAVPIWLRCCLFLHVRVVSMSKATVDPYDNPARNQATLSNLVNNMRLIHVMPLLGELTFDQVTELWWEAQQRKATQQEHDALCLANRKRTGAA
jgi:hypothetical protein